MSHEIKPHEYGTPNEEKNLLIETSFGTYERYPVQTHVIKPEEELSDLMNEFIVDKIQPGDYLFISEKVVAITQGRAFDIDTIKPSKLANFLVKFVYKSPYGIGIGSPWTMELALRDVGIPRMLVACAASAVTKPFGVRGVFYKVAGTKARAIDGPSEHVIAPYNHYAKMAPKDPDKVAAKLADQIGCGVVIIDANDIGVEILGRSSKDIDIKFCKEVFKDNPLGQTSQATPFGIVRKVK